MASHSKTVIFQIVFVYLFAELGSGAVKSLLDTW